MPVTGVPALKKTIGTTPLASVVNPSDLIWIWQAGQLLAAPASLLVSGGLPVISTLGTVTTGVWNATPISNAFLAQVANGTIKANISGATASPSDVTLSQLIDAVLGNSIGAILYRSAAGWAVLTPGPVNSVLTSQGPGAVPSYQFPPGTGTVTSIDASGGSTGLTFSGGPITTIGTLTMGGTLAVANGGTGAGTPALARAGLGAAASGPNADITSLSALSTPLSVSQGGTGASTIAGAQTALGLNFVNKQSLTNNTSSIVIDVSQGGMLALTLNATITSFSVINWPVAGIFGRLVIEVTNNGSFNITSWPGSTIWPNGTAPNVTSGAGAKDTYLLTSSDGGNNFRGYIIAQNLH